jgi:hypothetical protein
MQRLPVRAHQAPLGPVLGEVALEHLLHELVVGAAVVPMRDLVEPPRQQLPGLVAEHLAEGAVHLNPVPLRAQERLANGGLGERGPQALLARLERRVLLVQIDEDRDLRAQDPGVVRLEDVIHGAGGIAAEDVVRLLADGRDEDDRDVLRALPLLDELGGLETVHPRHLDVEEDHGEIVLEQALERFFSGACVDHIELERVEHRVQRHEVLGLVVDEQDARCLGHAALRAPPQATIRNGAISSSGSTRCAPPASIAA